MNAKSLYTACLFTALSLGAISAHADTKTSDAGHAGSALNIKKVLSWSQDASSTCDIVNAQLTYLNAQGETRTLNYRRFADSCNTTN